MLHSEFRDGNVPAGFEQLRVLQDALTLLPDDVQTVSLRSDSAGYQTELFKYCAEGKNARFGVIDFAVSADVNADFRRAALATDVAWKPLCDAAGRPNEDEQEYAEVALVPSWIDNGRKDAPEYRFLAIREPLRRCANSIYRISRHRHCLFRRKSLRMPDAINSSAWSPIV